MAFNHACYQFNGWILRMGFFENVIRQKIACSLFSCHCLRQWLLFLYTPQSSVSLHDITSWHHFVTISNLLFKQAKFALKSLQTFLQFCDFFTVAQASVERCHSRSTDANTKKRSVVWSRRLAYFHWCRLPTFVHIYISRFATWLPKQCNSYRSRHLKIYFKPSWKTL